MNQKIKSIKEIILEQYWNGTTVEKWKNFVKKQVDICKKLNKVI